jgi:hypothetical protein
VGWATHPYPSSPALTLGHTPCTHLADQQRHQRLAGPRQHAAQLARQLAALAGIRRTRARVGAPARAQDAPEFRG